MNLINGEALEQLKLIPNKSVDFIGIEIDEEIFNSAKKRVEEKRKEKDLTQKTLFGDEM